MLLTVEIDRQRELAILHLTGRLDGTQSDQLRGRIVGLLSTGEKRFLIDLDGIDFIDELGIGTLATVTALVRAKKGFLFLTTPPPDLYSFFELTGTVGVFDFRKADGTPLESASSSKETATSESRKRSLSESKVTPETEAQPSRYIGTEALLEVTDPILGTRSVSVSKSPFLIGRGSDNDLLLFDKRISRHSATIIFSKGHYKVYDPGNRSGTFVNGKRIRDSSLGDGDQIDFGLSDSFKLIFRIGSSNQKLDKILTQMDDYPEADPRARALRQMGLLLEASALVHSQLPMEEILAAVVDRAIELTNADRGALLECGDNRDLSVVVARKQGAQHLSPDGLQFLAIDEAKAKKVKGAKDLTMATTWRESQSGSEGHSRTQQMMWCCLPLFEPGRSNTCEDTEKANGDEPKGALYLETDRTPGFRHEPLKSRAQQEQILQALAVQAAGVLTNARFVEREMERSRLNQELAIANRIQQSLLPGSTKKYGHAVVSGINRPCYAVGGDYFDHMNLSSDRLAFIIADVCGKGLGAALVTTMLQGTMSAMTLGSTPADLFNNTNRFLCEHAVGRHVTLFFGLLSRNGEFRYINAGHHSPLLVKDGEIRKPFEDGCPPLGLFQQTHVVEGNHHLDAGDLLLFYTDGIPEAMNAQEEEYGMERFEESVRSNTSDSVSSLQDAVLERLDRFTAGNNPVDDVTMMIVRYTGCTTGHMEIHPSNVHVCNGLLLTI